MDHIRVSKLPSKGQGLLTRHPVTPQTTLYTTSRLPLAAINTLNLDKFCYNCYAASNPVTDATWYSIGQHRDAHLQVCTGCHVAHFCSRKCQSRAWRASHKFECAVFAGLPRTLPAQVRAAMTFILQHDNGVLGDGVWSSILASKSHLDEFRRRNDDDWTGMMLMAKACHGFSGTEVDVTVMLQLICILKVNGLTLSTTAGDEIGVFLDPVLLRINHDCNGNVAVHRPSYTNEVGWPRTHVDQPVLKLVALRPLAAGEELVMSYIDFTSHVTYRQEELKRNYLFTCTCTACLRDTRKAECLNATKPDVARQRTEWQGMVRTWLEKLKYPPFPVEDAMSAMSSVVAAMEAQSETCFLPSTDPYPQAIHELKILYMDRGNTSQALVCALKEHLLVGPAVYSSAVYPTRIVNAIYLLQVLALLDDEQVDGRDLAGQRREVEGMGLSRRGIKYWRLRICVEGREKLMGTPMEDLAACFEFEQMSVGVNDRSTFEELLGSADARSMEEDAIRRVLRLSEERWERLVRPGLQPMVMNGTR